MTESHTELRTDLGLKPVESLNRADNKAQLRFTAPRRGRPPTHFADLSPDERKQAVRDLGLPAFRANQLARHYYGRFEATPETMTDLPVAARQPVQDALFPRLMIPVRNISCDEGPHGKPCGSCMMGRCLSLS